MGHASEGPPSRGISVVKETNTRSVCILETVIKQVKGGGGVIPQEYERQLVKSYLKQHASEIIIRPDCRKLTGCSHLYRAVGRFHCNFGLTCLSRICQEGYNQDRLDSIEVQR